MEKVRWQGYGGVKMECEASKGLVRSEIVTAKMRDKR